MTSKLVFNSILFSRRFGYYTRDHLEIRNLSFPGSRKSKFFQNKKQTKLFLLGFLKLLFVYVISL